MLAQSLRLAAALPVALALTGCGDAIIERADPVPTPSPTAAVTPPGTPPAGPPTPGATAVPTPSPAAALRCANPAEGYALRYDARWFVARGEGIEPCTFFDPEPLQLEPGTEATGVAIRLDVRDVAVAQARGDTGGDQEERSIGGRLAVRATGVEDDDPLLPPGTRFTTWLVDLEGRTLILTADTAAGGDYAEHVRVLDAMVQTVQAA